MKYITFAPNPEGKPRLGALLAEDQVLDLTDQTGLPETMLAFIQAGPTAWTRAELLTDQLTPQYQLSDIILHAPLPRPPSLRDFYAFEDHIMTSYQNRGRPVPKTWYKYPVFFFINPAENYGHGQEVPIPPYTEKLDFELEVAAVIGKAGRDIAPEQAMEHIFGFTIFNDWSARDVQLEEMKVGLGPAKGKDFANSFGPTLLTPNEIADRVTDRPGVYNLTMEVRVNGRKLSHGNWQSLYYSFGEMIARASQSVTLYPGDMIGSGTVGSGCLLELTSGEGPWLKKGDLVELEIDRFGILANRIV